MATTMIARVTGAPARADTSPILCTRVVPSPFWQSGHRWPTGASIEQSGQMNLPHVEHANRVGRSGWR